MWIRIRVSAVGSSENARNASTLFCLVFPKGLSDARMNDKLFSKFFRTTDYADKTDGGLCGKAKG